MRWNGVGKRRGMMLLLGASWLALGVTGHAGEPGIVRISASIFSVESDGNEKPLGEAEVTAPLGEWARFRKGQDIPSVVQYSLPSIPKEISESVVGASGEAPEFETNELSVVIPSHPEKVETLELGLSGRFRPRVLANGTLTVDAEIGYREVLESIEKAEPIYFVKKNAAGKEKKILVTRNETRAPVTRSRKTSVHYTRKKGETKGVVIPVSGPDSDSSLIVRMKVAPVEPGEKNTKAIPAGNFFYITSRFVEITEGEMENEEDLYPDKPVLSDAEFQMWIRRINQQKGVDLLSAPSLVVKPGQDGKIEVVREFIYPTSFQPPSLEGVESTSEAEKGSEISPVQPASPIVFETENVGVSLSLNAKRSSRKGHVELFVEPRVDQFHEFVNFGKPVQTWTLPALGPPKTVVVTENKIQYPIFERLSMQTVATIPDGSTLVVGGLTRQEIQTVEDKVPILGDLPLIGRFGRSRTELHYERKLIILVTVRSVDSSGMPVE